jgi:hypothetical protein
MDLVAPMSDVRNTIAALFGIFDRVLMIPEPFLAALGYRDDARIAQTNYHYPVVNSVFSDIGVCSSDHSIVGHWKVMWVLPLKRSWRHAHPAQRRGQPRRRTQPGALAPHRGGA